MAFFVSVAHGRSSKSAPPAADTLTFRLEHSLTLSSISGITWFRDGTRVAFVVTAADTAENTSNADIWIADLRTDESRRLTRHPKSDASPTFSPIGDTLAFVATRGTGDDAKQAIYMLSLHGGDPWPAGTYKEAVTEVAWSPDGRFLAYVMLDTLSREARDLRKKKWDPVIEDEVVQYPQLWAQEIATGVQRRLTSGPLWVWNVRWAPDSRSLAFLTSPTGRPDDSNLQDIGVVPVNGGPVRQLGLIGAEFTWSPDGNWIACATGIDRAREVQKTDLWLVPASGGAPTNLTADYDGDATTPSWSPSSDTLFFHTARGVSTVVATVARTGGPVILGVDRFAECGPLIAAPTGRVAWTQSSPTAPTELWLADRPRESGRAITTLNESVSSLHLGSTRVVRWISTDGVKVEGVLLRPTGVRPNVPLKTLVLLHGGPYGSRYGFGFQALPQFLAAHGYQVFMPNFRSSGGYGTAFLLRTRSDWGGQDWRDVMTGIDSLVKWKLADGERLGVFGHSYGGYLTAWAITHTDRFDAACVNAGAVDLAAHYGQSDVQRYRAFEFEGAPWETPEKWSASSPMTYIRNAKTPTLIISGETDARVPYAQGQQLYRALLGLHVPTVFVHYPREGHTLREPRHRADFTLRLLNWFDRWVR
jgi:dipeptidyl aminopeptidase/acylaminoacyl peptidase